MIIRKGNVPADPDGEGRADRFGAFESLRYSDAGGLGQFGAYVETLQPGSSSSERHWHEKDDEFLYVLAGEVTIVEEAGDQVLRPGDAACWPAGNPNAHRAVNHSSAPCSYLIVGTRHLDDVCHYPDVGQVCYSDGETWRLVANDGTVIKSGRR